ncbi:MAG: hypothetical protein RLZZ242_396 [Bacteroidota bacterium]|jgi:Xaa-Pro aminopeptidase
MKGIKITAFVVVFLATLFTQLAAQTQGAILPMRERARVINELLEDKIENYLPQLMQKTGIDMWVVVSREYNEDPVIKTLLPAEWLAARRRTILVFFNDGDRIETLAVARYDVGAAFKSAWDKEKQPDQWARLRELVEERNPKSIGINQSKHFGLADGIVATDKEELLEALGSKFAKRVVSAEKLAIAWLETRTAKEMAIYPHIERISHNIIAEAFSEKVITPGVTTTEDVVWFMRDKVRELGLQTWFHPTVDIQRADPERFDHLRTFSKRPDTQVILPGDLLHCDFGITYLRLNTDQQQHAYVLAPGETDAPEYLKKALATGNRLQDIFTNHFKEGRTGNEVLAMSRAQAIEEGITPSIYTHPIGYHGHAAGTTLGMWDAQEGVPYTGDYPLHLNTAYSIELNASVFIKEWNKDVRIMLEEEAFFDENGVRYIDGRQEQLILVNKPFNSL